MTKKFSSFIVLLFLLPIAVWGREVSLRVVCKESKAPLQAMVQADYGVLEAVSVMCDRSGRAFVELPDTSANVIVDISYEGRYPVILTLAPDAPSDLGTVELESKPVDLSEVVVYGDNSALRAGKRTLIPSEQQIKRNFNASQLLTDMQSMAPELEINPIMRTISINGESPVFKVNGRVQSVDRLIDLAPDRIARIEYTNYRDLQYNAPVINIILKPAEMGGYVSLYDQSALTTLKSYAKATGAFNYKKSEFLFDYNYIYRNSTDEITREYEGYVAPDFEISRYGQGLPSSTIDQYHRFLLEYSLLINKNSIFVLSGDVTLHRNRNANGISYLQCDGSDNSEKSFDSWNRRHFVKTPFSFGAFYKYNAGKHSVEASASVARSSNDYNRRLTYSDGYDFGSRSHNKGLSANAEAVYGLSLPSNVNLSFGAKFTHVSSDVSLWQDGYAESSSDMHSNEFYVYGKAGWSNRGFSVTGGPGIRHIASFNGASTETFTSWRGVVSMSQQAGRKLTIGYTFTIDPAFPSLANLTTVVQHLNDFSVQVGNPDLKSAMSMSHNLRLNYRLGSLRMSPYASYRFIDDPILESWSYSSADGYFIRSSANARSSHDLTCGLNVSASNLFGKVNVSVDFGCNSFRLNLPDESISKSHMFCRVNASAYFGAFNVNLQCMPVRGIQYQGLMYTRQTAFNSISATYTYRRLQFGLSWQNPLTRKAVLSQRFGLSKVHPTQSEYCIKDFNNMVLLSVQYRLAVGKEFKKPRVSTGKVSTSDIITAY